MTPIYVLVCVLSAATPNQVRTISLSDSQAMSIKADAADDGRLAHEACAKVIGSTPDLAYVKAVAHE